MWKSVCHRIEGELEELLWEAVDGCGPVLCCTTLIVSHSQLLHRQASSVS